MKLALFTILLISSVRLYASGSDCSFQRMMKISSQLDNELNAEKSMKFDTYGAIENVMLCDLDGKLEPKLKKKLLSKMNAIKEAKPTPFVWASKDGVEFWDDGVTKMGFLPEGLRETIPVILSQLNSAVVAFVPSDGEGNGTRYQFEADLGIDLFSPWDRRSCHQMSKENLDTMAEYLTKERITKEDKSNFTRNYSAIEVSKIGVKNKPICYWYEDSQEIMCEQDFASSVVHESLHFLNDRFPNFSERIMRAEGGYHDRLKIAQEVVPQFGKTMCTPYVWEPHCDDGPITQEQADEIAKRAKLPQNSGMIVGKQYAREFSPDQQECWGASKFVERHGKKYCVSQDEANLYTLVRGGDEYLQVLYENAIMRPEHFNGVASDEEKRIFKVMKEYLF